MEEAPDRMDSNLKVLHHHFSRLLLLEEMEEMVGAVAEAELSIQVLPMRLMDKLQMVAMVVVEEAAQAPVLMILIIL